MGGLISRDAALEVVKEFFKAQVDAIPKDADFEVVTNTCDLILEHNAGVLKAIGTLPTIEPSVNRSEFPNSSDTISRQAAIDAVMAVYEWHDVVTQDRLIVHLRQLPSAQPEITDEQAIDHLQKSGWMQNYDKQMYEAGLKERLADDSGSYDALLPSAQLTYTDAEIQKMQDLEQAQIEKAYRLGYEDGEKGAQSEQRWIPVTERLPEIGEYVLCMIRWRYCGRFHVCHYVDKDKYVSRPHFDWQHNGFPDVVAWMPLPEPYKENEQDG